MGAGPAGPRLGRLEEGLDAASARELLRRVWLDAIGALQRVDGTSVSSVGPPATGPGAVAGGVPAGVEVLRPAGADRGDPDDPLTWGLRAHLRRAFERVAAVSPDAVPIRPRAVSMALSALGWADVVVGPTPAGGVYLVGVRCERGADLIAGLEGGGLLSAAALLAEAQAAGLVARTVERVPRLAELTDLAALRSAVGRAPELPPCVAAWLGRPDA